MVFVKHNSLKSYIFFNPIFIPGFSGSRFFRVQVFQGPGFSGSKFFRVQDPGPGSRSGSRVWVQVLEVAMIIWIKMPQFQFMMKIWKNVFILGKYSPIYCKRLRNIPRDLKEFRGVKNTAISWTITWENEV